MSSNRSYLSSRIPKPVPRSSKVSKPPEVEIQSQQEKWNKNEICEEVMSFGPPEVVNSASEIDAVSTPAMESLFDESLDSSSSLGAMESYILGLQTRSAPLYQKSALPDDASKDFKSLSEMKSPKAGGGGDMDVIYAGNPIRMDSSNQFAVAAASDCSEEGSSKTAVKQRRSPTYLQMFQQQQLREMANTQFSNTTQTAAHHAQAEIHTQTSAMLQGGNQTSGIDQAAIFTQTSATEQAAIFTQTSGMDQAAIFTQTSATDQTATCTQTSNHHQVATSSTSTPSLIRAEESLSKASLLDEAKPPSGMMSATEPEDSDIGDGEDSTISFEKDEAEAAITDEESLLLYDEDGEESEQLQPKSVEIEMDSEIATLQKHTSGGSGTGTKKAKTIFSVELPMTESKMEQGPGQNGDGHDVGASPSTEKKLSHHTLAECEEQEMIRIQHFEDEESEVEEITDLKQEVSRVGLKTSAHLDKEAVTPQVAFVGDGGSGIEILPSPLPLDMKEDAGKGKEKDQDYGQLRLHQVPSNCAALLSKKSSLILCRGGGGDPNSPNVYSGFLPILNSTAFVHGYKVHCNNRADKILAISPKMGLIPPGTQVNVKVESKRLVEQLTGRTVSEANIKLKLFRSYCEEDDGEKLRDYYEKLADQHPEMIRTQHIKKIVLWDGDNLPGMLHLVNSVEDKKEREVLKKEIYRRCSKASLTENELSNKADLNALRNDILTANEQLKQTFRNLDQLEKLLHGLMFFGILGFGYMMILPYIRTDVIVEETNLEPEVEPTMYESFVNTLLGAYDWAHGIMEGTVAYVKGPSY